VTLFPSLRLLETPDRPDKDGAESSVPLHPSSHVLDSLRPAGTQPEATLDYHIIKEDLHCILLLISDFVLCLY
jgi:hypothetical protein